MKKIGGNIQAQFQSLSVQKNSIGEEIPRWETIGEARGWLDFSGGGSSYLSHNAKTEESTHVFLCDKFDIDKDSVNRLLIGGKAYDVSYFDEPMGLGSEGGHYEIWLKEVEQNAGA